MQKGYYRFFCEPVIDKQHISVIKECVFEEKIIFSKLQNRGINITIIEKGSKIIELIPPNEMRNYIDSQSKAKKSKDELLKSYKLSSIKENVISDNSEKSFYAIEEGVILLQDETVSLIPIHFDGVLETILSDDKIRLDLSFYPPYKDGKALTHDDVISKLVPLSITTDINTALIDESLVKLTETQQPVLNVTVAEGIKPVDGTDAYIEHFVFADGIGPTVDEFGRTDYRNLNLVVPIAKDQKIVLFHPAKPGVVGKDIFGKEILPKEGEKCLFPTIENTYKSPTDNNLLLSKIDGSAYFKRSNITIAADYYIPEDVDYHTGNIHSNGSVKVGGDVKTGFQLDVGGNLDIGGCVEDAVINCKGSVNIKEGFIGTGKGIIKSDGTVKCHFINQQTIYSRDSIIIEGECIDANLYAKNSIRIGGTKISAVGGFIIAGKLIETEFLGNMYNVKTFVEVGYDYEMKDELKKNKQQQDELNEKLKKVKMIYVKLDRLDELNEEQIKMQEMMKEQVNLIEKNLAELEKRNDEICKLIRTPSKAVIKIKKTVFPGVIIAINTHKLIVQEESSNRTFCINEESEIVAL